MNQITEVPITGPKEKPHRELFIGGYTGKLTSLVMKDNRMIRFTPPIPIVLGVPYVLEYTPSTKRCRFIHLIVPRI